MNARDAAQIGSEVRRLAARHEALHEKLSKVIGAHASYREMSTPALARYGLQRLGVEPPEGDEAAITALEFYLQGHASRSSGVAGMDAAAPSFLDKYLNSN